jgi:hypothetical protein
MDGHEGRISKWDKDGQPIYETPKPDEQAKQDAIDADWRAIKKLKRLILMFLTSRLNKKLTYKKIPAQAGIFLWPNTFPAEYCLPQQTPQTVKQHS